MLLYDVFHSDGSFDSGVRLPKTPGDSVRYAVCVNGEREYLVARDGEWVTVTQEEALGER